MKGDDIFSCTLSNGLRVVHIANDSEVAYCGLAVNAGSRDELPGKCRLFGVITIPAGASIGVHEHVGECEMFYILQGEPVTIDDASEYTAHPGDCILTHSGHRHGVKNPGAEPVVMVANIVKD